MYEFLKKAVLFATALAVTGCGEERTAVKPSNERADAVVTSEPTNTATKATVTATYACQPELDLNVAYSEIGSTSVARLTIDGNTYDLMNVISASGAKYATDQGRFPGKTLIWWTKGRDGTLYEGDVRDAAGADVEIATCSERTR